MEKNVSVMLVDHHGIMRTGLYDLLASQKWIELVGVAENGEIALQLFDTLQPDIVIVDVSTPYENGQNGIDITRRLVLANPKVAVIGFSVHSERQFEEAMEAAGARSYLLKGCDFKEILKSIKDCSVAMK